MRTNFTEEVFASILAIYWSDTLVWNAWRCIYIKSHCAVFIFIGL